MKIIVIGGIAGGMSAAARCKRLDENAEVIVFERGDLVAFSNCGLPYHISEDIETSDDLILLSANELKVEYGLDVRVRHEVIKIDRKNKVLTVRNDEGEFEESYDKVIMSPGGVPIEFDIPGLDTVEHSHLRTVADAAKIHDTMKDNDYKNAVVVGGGYIGLEAAENLRLADYNVALVEALPQILNTMDEDMVQILHKEMYDKGVDLRVGTKLEAIEDGYAVVSKGEKIPCDYLVLAAGIRPVNELAKDAGLELTERGYIKVDANQQTNDPNIYAIGDATEVFNMMSRQFQPLALAGPAQKQSRRAADHIFGKTSLHPGYIGSSAIKLFDYNAAKTGLSCKELDNLGITNYDYVIVIPKEKVGIMPGAENQFFKLIFEKPTGRLLGAQCVSKGEAVKRVDVVAAMLPFGATLEDAANVELCYAPPFSIARDSINFAGLIGMNLLTDRFRQVHMTEARKLVENEEYILDVRPQAAFDAGHIKGAHSIPLEELRDRYQEIPKDRPVYIHCRTSKNSYYAISALQGLGYDNITNIQGSILGLSHFEYFKDQTEDRESILTDYNFL